MSVRMARPTEKQHLSVSRGKRRGPVVSKREDDKALASHLLLVRRSFFACAIFAFVYVATSVRNVISKPHPPKLRTVVRLVPEPTLAEVARNARLRQRYAASAIGDHNGVFKEDVLIVAHRGCRSRFPENSLASIAACAEDGAQIAEIDVELTADGVAVLLHDRSPERVANIGRTPGTASKVIGDLTLKEVKELWLTKLDQSSLSTPYKIPTLQEAMGVAKACGIQLLLRTKKKRGIADAIREAIDATEGGWNRVIFGPTVGWSDGFKAAILDNKNRSGAFFESPLQQQNDTAQTMRKGPNKKVVIFSSFSQRKHVRDVCGKLGLRLDCANRATASNNKTVDVASFSPTGPARTDYAWQRIMRDAGTGTVVSFLWDEGGEYFLRDSRNSLEKTWPNATNEAAALDASFFEALNTYEKTCLADPARTDTACLGAKLWIPTLRATKARFAVTDAPRDLRDALKAFNADAFQAWPLDPPMPNDRPPKCLELANSRDTTARHH